MQDIKYMDETARVYLGYYDGGFCVVTVFLSFSGGSLDFDTAEWTSRLTLVGKATLGT